MLPGHLASRCLALAAVLLASCSPEQRDFGPEPPPQPPGGCVAAEACFNGFDDDCDGTADCGDSDCAAGAVCVPSATSFAHGVLVAPDDPCPAGFTAEQTLIYRGLTGGGCEGCSCVADPTDCRADVWFYNTEAACNADVAMTQGTSAGSVGFMCTPQPLNDGVFEFGGVRVSDFQVLGSCTASGTPAAAPAGWQDTRKLCRAAEVGIGCDAGFACVAKQEPASQCALVSGSASCEGYGTVQNDWYTGYSDTRSCTSCGCTAVGGSCDEVLFELGNDYSCFENQNVARGSKWCGYAYSPPGRLVGTPTQATCEVDGGLTGSLDPTGQSTLCCLQ